MEMSERLKLRPQPVTTMVLVRHWLRDGGFLRLCQSTALHVATFFVLFFLTGLCIFAAVKIQREKLAAVVPAAPHVIDHRKDGTSSSSTVPRLHFDVQPKKQGAIFR